MRLRPVNAIFVQPKSKFIVIYQDGKLWQTARMKLDKNSWQRRKPYTGSDIEIFLRPDQTIDDEFLAKLLPTEELPSSLTRVTLAKFLTWWQLNAYDFLKAKKEQGAQPVAEAVAAQPIDTDITNNSDKPAQSNPQTSTNQAANQHPNQNPVAQPAMQADTASQQARTSALNPKSTSTDDKPKVNIANIAKKIQQNNNPSASNTQAQVERTEAAPIQQTTKPQVDAVQTPEVVQVKEDTAKKPAQDDAFDSMLDDWENW